MRAVAALLLTSALLASSAQAAQQPKPVRQDEHVQIVPYDENNPVYLHLRAGHTAVVEISDKERITDIFLSDSSSLRKKDSGHFAFFKPLMHMPPQPIFIKATKLDGSGDRLYPLVLDATDPDPPPGLPGENGQVAKASTDVFGTDDGRPYIVRFTYPAEAAKKAAAQREAAAKIWRAKRDMHLAAAKLREPAPTVINTGYQAQGTPEEQAALAPNATWDDGQSTYFRFDGNRRLPVPYVLNPDGKEAVVDYTVQDRTLIIHQTAARFRLRDGDQILCVFNPTYSPAGFNPGTGTTSPDVVREMKPASG